MPLNQTPLPYGLRDVKLRAYTDSSLTTLAASAVDLPFAQTFSFTDSEDFNTLRGDDREVASHGSGPTVQWQLESGGLPYEAFQIMAGGTITASGTTPGQKKVLTKKVTDSRPYFQVEGQAISDSGGDVHVTLPRCKATGDLSGEWKDGEFFVTSASGDAFGSLLPDSLDVIYTFTQNETVTAIS